MAYCDRCGTWAALDDAAMCDACRRDWRPASLATADLGYHAHPQPSVEGRAFPAERGSKVHLDP
jgi:hypothetical protein